MVIVLCVVGLYGCGVPSADGPADSFGIDFSLPPDARRDGTIIFLVDGVNAAIFEEMLDHGDLPAMKKYFVDRGTYVRRGVANVPTVTLANLTSVVTGQFPGHHNIPGVNWFDRNKLVWRNYDTIAQKNTLDDDYVSPNIYEQFPDRLTFSLFLQPHRHATKFYENRNSAGPAFLFGLFDLIDRISLHRMGRMMEIAREYKQFPAVATCYMLAPDFMGYRHGGSTEQYRQALQRTDRYIGRVLGDAERAGLLEDITIVFVSDHGFGDARTHFELKKHLTREVGLRLGGIRWWENDPFESRLADLRKYAGMISGSGDRFMTLYLRKPVRDVAGRCVGYEHWLTRPDADDLRRYPTTHGRDVDLPAHLTSLASVDIIAYRAGDERIRVACEAGEVEFAQPGGQGQPITYRVVRGGDPLAWHEHLSSDARDGAPLSPQTWFELTAGSDLPDLPEQILAYFRSTRAGDIAIFAKPDHDFRRVNNGAHGGVRPVDMHIPILFAGPGVPHQRIDHARSVDILPTILHLNGRPMPHDLDGKPLFEKRRSDD